MWGLQEWVVSARFQETIVIILHLIIILKMKPERGYSAKRDKAVSFHDLTEGYNVNLTLR